MTVDPSSDKFLYAPAELDFLMNGLVEDPNAPELDIVVDRVLELPIHSYYGDAMDIKIGGASFREVVLPQLPLYGEMPDLIAAALDNLGNDDRATAENSLEEIRRISAECCIAAVCLEKVYQTAIENFN
jgi:hypothetical protein